LAILPTGKEVTTTLFTVTNVQITLC